MDQVRLNNPGLVMKIIFQVGTIDAVAAMGKLVIQSSERIAFFLLAFTFLLQVVTLISLAIIIGFAVWAMLM